MTSSSSPNRDSVRGTDHPYYAAEGCYYAKAGPGDDFPHYEHDSWADFLEENGDNDLDMNLLYRWDWDPQSAEDALEFGPEPEQVQLYFMQQRKARPVSIYVTVTPEDEPAVRAYLEVRAAHLRTLWSPLLRSES